MPRGSNLNSLKSLISHNVYNRLTEKIPMADVKRFINSLTEEQLRIKNELY